MAMTTQSPTATIAATRAGTRILMREGDDYGARSLQRRRRRGGVATAQRNATHGRRRGARDTAHARRGAQTLERGRANLFRRARSKMHRQEGRDGRDGISATTGSGAPCEIQGIDAPSARAPSANARRLANSSLLARRIGPIGHTPTPAARGKKRMSDSLAAISGFH